MHKSLIILLLVALLPGQLCTQPLNLKYDHADWINIEQYLYTPGSMFHTSVRPYSIPEINQVVSYDSAINDYVIPRFRNGKVTQRIFNNHLLTVEENDFRMTINPLFDFSTGYERQEDKQTWTNTRGILVEGTVGEDFAFSTRFYENQSVFPGHIQDYIGKRRVVPGQGMVRGLNGAMDYASAAGYLSYTPGEYFNFQLGHGNQFLGDGYRSLLLSDHAIYYPYFKINSTIWRFKYVNLWTQFNHPDAGVKHGFNAFPHKYGAFQYLSFLAGKRWNISIFESVIWQAQDSIGYRGFDLNYLNPIVLFLPIENTTSSADNYTVGANISFNAHQQMTLYTQFLLDEFRFREMVAGNGWFGNKYGFQAGIKLFEPLNIKNLYIQAEYNLVRPYSYSHYLQVQSYTHFNEPLAYSFGANTKELIFRGNYHYKRFYLHIKFNHALFGLDQNNLNYGKNIFLNSKEYMNEYGNYIGQGLETTMEQLDGSVSYLVNPVTNMNLFAGFTYRTETNIEFDNTYFWINFGFRTSLRNLYYDFY